MKSKNRDINVVEQENVPQFSELDDIGTSLRLFELFFVDVLVDMIFGYTKMQAIERKQTLVFKISNETFCLFLGVSLLSGCQKLPDCKINWETPPDTFLKAMSDSMSRLNVFFEISIIMATNNLINKTNSRNIVP